MTLQITTIKCLPVEILHQILASVHPPTFPQLRLVCRFWRKLVDGSPSFPLATLCYRCGYDIVPERDITIEERQDALLEAQRLWSNVLINPKPVYNIPLEENAARYENENIVALSRDPSGEASGFKIMTLGRDSIVREHVLRSDIGHDHVKACIDASQDLVVLYKLHAFVQFDSFRWVYHFFSLSTGLPHPQAHNQGLILKHRLSGRNPLNAIYGKLMVMVDPNSVSLVHWPTGALLARWEDRERQYRALLPLDDTYMLLVRYNLRMPAPALYLDLYRLSSEGPVHLATFGFPTVRPAIRNQWPNEYNFSAPHRFSLDKTRTSLPPITPSRSLMHLDIESPTSYQYVSRLICPIETFLPGKFFTEGNKSKTSHGRPPVIPWDTWGPNNSWWLKHDEPPQSVFGYRVLTRSAVYDFNPHRAKRLDDPLFQLGRNEEQHIGTTEEFFFEGGAKTNAPYWTVPGEFESMFPFEDADGVKMAGEDWKCYRTQRNRIAPRQVSVRAFLNCREAHTASRTFGR